MIFEIFMKGVIMIDYSKYQYAVSASGRINIIGEHVDYCGGKVFPAALSLKNTVYIKPNGTDKINISWTTLDETVTLDINKLDSYRNLKYGNYQAGSAYVLQQAGYKILGCDMLQDCSVPFGSGLSSSAAIEVSTIAALLTISGESLSNPEIALLAQKAEREYAGVNCGIMDQYASACGKYANAMILDCKTLNCEYVPIDLKDYSIVIANCNKPHNLVESKYNERRAETEEALKKLQTKYDVTCLADLSVSDFEKSGDLLSGKVYDRAKHVVYECERVNLAKKAMISGDLVGLGQLLNQSHASLRDLYEVTGEELDALQAAEVQNENCLGARMIGAGFGGCTIAIVLSAAVEDFKKEVTDKYEKAIGYKPTFYDAYLDDGITVKKI